MARQMGNLDNFEENSDFLLGGAMNDEPDDSEGNIKRVNFMRKANELFRDAKKLYDHNSAFDDSKECESSEPDVSSDQFDNKDQRETTKREAQLESAIKILNMKLEYTQRKIMESENSKIVLKSELDNLINKLALSGYDPNFKIPTASATPQYNTQNQEQTPTTTVQQTNWEKLQTLAEEYERRITIVNELEDQEKYFLKKIDETPLEQTS